MTYYAHEVDIMRLKVGDIKSRGINTNDFSAEVSYNAGPLFVQISDARIVFGLMTYYTPQGNYERNSIGIDFDDDSMNETRQFLESLQYWVRSLDLVPKTAEFFSFVRENERGQSHIRVKIPCNNNGRSNTMLYVNGQEYCKPQKQMLHTYLEHNTRADVILKLNPIWYSGGKVGLSWVLDAASVTTRHFRTPLMKPPTNSCDYKEPTPTCSAEAVAGDLDTIMKKEQ